MSKLTPKIKINLLNDKYKLDCWLTLSSFDEAMTRLRNFALTTIEGVDEDAIYDEAQGQLIPYGLIADLDLLAFDIVDSIDFIDDSSVPTDKSSNPCLVSICDDITWGIEYYGALYIAAMNFPLISDHGAAVAFCESVRVKNQQIEAQQASSIDQAIG